MVLESASPRAGHNFLKRKMSIDDSFHGNAVDVKPTDPRRARFDPEQDSDDDMDDDDSFSSTSEDGDSCSSDESETEDIIHQNNIASTVTSSGTPLTTHAQSEGDGSSSPLSTDSDPDHGRAVHRNRRKSSRPMKSPDPEDPKFKGVTVQFRTLIHQDQVQLVITAYFNCRKLVRRRNPYKHACLATSTPPTDNHMTSLDDVSPYNMRRGRPNQVYYPSGKQCASCCTRKTPLWRDAEDGTPLCNACGIRYKKYRVRCGHCWFVPKKDSKTNPVCSNCGERFRYSVLRFKHSII